MKNILKKEIITMFIIVFMIVSTVLVAIPMKVAAASNASNEPPVAKITDSSGTVKYWWTSRTNTFYGDKSYDPDGDITYHWWTIYDGDGKHEWSGPGAPTSITYTHKYASPSSGWLVVLGVQDNDCEVTYTTAKVLCGGGTPDLKITKIDTPDPVNAGEVLTYKIKVCNNDPTIDPKIVDNYDQNNLTIIDADGGVDNGDTIVWDHVVIPGQDCVSYTVKALVDECIPNGTIIKNKAKVFYEGNLVDSAIAKTTVLNDKLCGLISEKKVKLIGDPEASWADEVNASVGDTVRFRLYFENNGDIPLYFTSIRDVLPAGLEYADNAVVNGTPKEPAVTDNLDGTTTLLWRLLPLPVTEDNELSVGETFTIEFDALVIDCGKLINKMYAPISNEVGKEGYLNAVEISDEATVNVECDEEPCLNYTPHAYDFGCLPDCNTSQTTFEIWNGCEGTLEYNLSWDQGWISEVTPTSGNSTGEHDTITVEVKTMGLYYGNYSCDIHITSNGGNGTFTVNLTVGDCNCDCGDNNSNNSSDDNNENNDNDGGNDSPPATNVPPTIEINTPVNQTLYFNGIELISLGRTIIIGPITIKTTPEDPDGTVEKVEFYIDDELKNTTTEAPYEWTWNEKAIGFRTITVKTYDNDGLTAEDSMDVIIINFARS